MDRSREIFRHVGVRELRLLVVGLPKASWVSAKYLLEMCLGREEAWPSIPWHARCHELSDYPMPWLPTAKIEYPLHSKSTGGHSIFPCRRRRKHFCTRVATNSAESFEAYLSECIPHDQLSWLASRPLTSVLKEGILDW